MATEKILNTKILLKYDTLANWEKVKATLVLKKGEVGIVEVPTGSSLNQTTPPAIMFKVGDGTKTFENLPWASALAADVYAWAKKSAPAVSDFNDIIAAARSGLISADSVVKTLNKFKGDINIVGSSDGYIGVASNENEISLSLNLADEEREAIASGITAEKVAVYDGYDAKITAAKNAADAKYTKPTDGIPKADLAEAVQTSLEKADTALQSHQDISGKQNKTISVSGITATTVETALVEAKKAGTDAASSISTHIADKANPHEVTAAQVGLGNVANKALDTAVTASSGNYITSGAVKTYVDSTISGVTQFDIVKVDSFDKLPTTGKKGVIYLVPDTHSDVNDSYDEYIWNTAITTPAYEKIGNTDVNLSGYVPTSRTVNGKALSSNITLGAADVGVTEANFPGLNKTGTVSSIAINGTAKTVSNGAVDLGTYLTSHQDISGKQDKAISLTGFTATTVEGALSEAKKAGTDAASKIDEAVEVTVVSLDYKDTAISGQFVTAVKQTDGVIAVTRSALPTATTSALGVVKADGTSINVASGTLSVGTVGVNNLSTDGYELILSGGTALD